MADSVRVLHVDDDVELLDVTARLVEHKCEDVSVTSVERPEDALALLEDGEFDCLVSDYRMPTMDGLRLRTIVSQSYPKLPFLLFTSVTYAEIRHSIPQQQYLRKSCPDQFENLVERIVELAENGVLNCNGHSASTGP